jgi:hypothetical protein
MFNQIPLDPTLPESFDNTPNEERGKDELDCWWDHPFAITTPDGKFDVRCLNGGAWDRSTWLGRADTYDEACKLAAEKQAAWVAQRGEPHFLMDPPGIKVVIMPQRPDQDMQVLGAYATQAEAAEAIQRWREKLGLVFTAKK